MNDRKASGRPWLILLALAIVVSTATPAWSAIVREWTFGTQAEGWTTAGTTTAIMQHNADGWPGIVYADCTGSDPQFISPTFGEAAAGWHRVEVRIATHPSGSTHQLKVYWRRSGDATFSESRSASLNYTSVSGITFRTVEIDVGSHSEWNGTIAQLRIDPSASACSPTHRFHIDSVRIQGTPAPPASPGLVGPADYSVYNRNHGGTIGFQWSSVSGASEYWLNVFPSGQSGNPVFDGSVGGATSHSIPMSAFGDGIYVWQVRAGNGGLWSAYSTSRQFITDTPPSAPVALAPADGSTYQSGDGATFSWNAPPGSVERYNLRIVSGTNLDNPPIVNAEPAATSSFQSFPTPPFSIGTHTWAVRAIKPTPSGYIDATYEGEIGWGDYSAQRTFQVQAPGQLSVSQPVEVRPTRTSPATIYALPSSSEYGNDAPFEDERNAAASFRLQNTGGAPIAVDNWGVRVTGGVNTNFVVPQDTPLTLAPGEQSVLFDKRVYLRDDQLSPAGTATDYTARVQVMSAGVWVDVGGAGSSDSFTVQPRPALASDRLVKRPRSVTSSDPADATIYYHRNGIKWAGTGFGLDGLFPDWRTETYVYPRGEVDALGAPTAPAGDATVPTITGRNLLFQTGGVDIHILEPEPGGGSGLVSRLFEDEAAFYSYGYTNAVLVNEPLPLDATQEAWISAAYPLGSTIGGADLAVGSPFVVYATRTDSSTIHALPPLVEYGGGAPVEQEKNAAATFTLTNPGATTTSIADWGVRVTGPNGTDFLVSRGSGLTLGPGEESAPFDERIYILDDALTAGGQTTFTAQIQINDGLQWIDLPGPGSSVSFDVFPRPPLAPEMLVKRPQSESSPDPDHAIVYYHQHGIKWEATGAALDGLRPGWQSQIYVYPIAEIAGLQSPSVPVTDPTVPSLAGRNLLYREEAGVDVYIVEPEPGQSTLQSRRFADEDSFYSYGYTPAALADEPLPFDSSQFGWIQTAYPPGTTIDTTPAAQLAAAGAVSVEATRTTPATIYALPSFAEYGGQAPVEGEKNARVTFSLRNDGSDSATVDDWGIRVVGGANTGFLATQGAPLTLAAGATSATFDRRIYLRDDQLLAGAQTLFTARIEVLEDGQWRTVDGAGATVDFTVDPRPPLANDMLVKRPRRESSSNPDDAIVYYHWNGRKWRGNVQGLSGLRPSWNTEYYVYPRATVDALAAPQSPYDSATVPEVTGRNLLYLDAGDVFIVEPEPGSGSGDWQYPTSPYQPGSYAGRTFYYDGDHLGEDVALQEGSPVAAVGDGTIVWYAPASGYGQLVVVIEHDLGSTTTFTNAHGDPVQTDSILSIYGHLRASAVPGGTPTGLGMGLPVSRGQIIGYVDNDATNGDGAEHVHMGIRLSDAATAQALDPGYWFRGYEGATTQGQHFAAASDVLGELIGSGAPLVSRRFVDEPAFYSYGYSSSVLSFETIAFAPAQIGWLQSEYPVGTPITDDGSGPLIPPDPIEPADDGITPDTSLTFSWTAVPGAARYKLKVTTDPGMSVHVAGSPFEPPSGQTSHTVPAATFVGGGTYYWQVQSLAPEDVASSVYGPAPPWSFSVQAGAGLTQPTPLGPADGHVASPGGQLFFAWSAPSGYVVQNYHLKIAAGTSIANAATWEDSTLTATFSQQSLAGWAPGTYTWGVRATPDGDDWSPFATRTLVICDPVDGDGDGWSGCAGDCDDDRAARYPDAPEQCDGFDNQCSESEEGYGETDEGCGVHPALRLPFPGGVAYQCTQGPGGTTSHTDGFSLHDLDFDTPNDSDETIVAAAAGVAYVHPDGGPASFGNHVNVDHGNGYFTVYAHLSSFLVADGQWVAQGDPIGVEGTTGWSTGDHVHFGLHTGDPQADALGSLSVPITDLVAADVTTGAGARSLDGDEFICGLPGGHSYRSNNEPADVPSAYFTWSPAVPEMGESVTFTNASTGSGLTWSWDLDGDGYPDATARDPLHTFASAGPAAVSLTATNAYGEDSVTLQIQVASPPAQPVVTGVTRTFAGVFLDGIDVENLFDVTVDWQGTPGLVRFQVDDRPAFDVPGTTTGAAHPFEMATDFVPRWTPSIVRMTAINGDSIAGSTVMRSVRVFPYPVWLEESLELGGGITFSIGGGEVRADIDWAFPDPPLEGRITIPSWVPYLSGEFGVEPTSAQVSGRVSSRGDGRLRLEGETGFAALNSSLSGRIAGDGQFRLAAPKGLELTRASFELELSGSLSKEIGVVEAIPALAGFANWPGVRLINERARLVGTVSPALDTAVTFRQDGGGELRFDGATADVEIEMRGTLIAELIDDHVTASGWVAGGGSVTLGVPEPWLRGAEFHVEAGIAVEFDFFLGFPPPLTLSCRVACAWEQTNGVTCTEPCSSGRSALADRGLELVKIDYARFGDYARFEVEEIGAAGDSRVPATVQESIVVSNLFPGASPAVEPTGEGRLLAWEHQDTADPVLQSTEIAWSYNDGFGWSEAALIADDTRAELAPQLGADTTGAVVAVWGRIKDPAFSLPIDDAEDLPSYYGLIEVVWSAFDPQAMTWSPVTQLTDDSAYDGAIRLAESLDGELLLTWTSNPAGTFESYGANTSDLMFARWDPDTSSWGPPAAIDSALSGVGTPVAVASSASATVLVPRDPDPSIPNDGVIDRYDWDGVAWSGPIAFAAGGVDNRLPSIVPSATEGGHVVWVRDGDLVFATLSDPSPVVIRADSDSMSFYGARLMTSPEGHLTLIRYEAVDNEPADLVARIYDPQSSTWSGDRRLTAEPGVQHFGFDGYFDDDGVLHGAYLASSVERMEETVDIQGQSYTFTNLPQRGQTDLRLLEHSLIRDIAIGDSDLDVSPPQPEPGDNVTASLTIHNSGDFAVATDVTVELWAGEPGGDGTLVESRLVTAPFPAGASAVLDFVFVQPESIGDLVAVLDPANLVVEQIETNNTAVHYRSNVPPVTRIRASVTNGNAPLSVDFDIATTYDPNGDAMTYAWSFGDGAPGAAGSATSHTFSQIGVFPVTLVATDAHGAVSSASVAISVGPLPAPPMPVPSGVSGGGSPMTAARSGTEVAVEWDTSTCGMAATYHLYAAAIGDFSRVTQGFCDIGDGSAVVPIAGDAVWWVVTGTNGFTVGSFGLDDDGRERTLTGWGAICAQSVQETAGVCP